MINNNILEFKNNTNKIIKYEIKDPIFTTLISKYKDTNIDNSIYNIDSIDNSIYSIDNSIDSHIIITYITNILNIYNEKQLNTKIQESYDNLNSYIDNLLNNIKKFILIYFITEYCIQLYKLLLEIKYHGIDNSYIILTINHDAISINLTLDLQTYNKSIYTKLLKYSTNILEYKEKYNNLYNIKKINNYYIRIYKKQILEYNEYNTKFTNLYLIFKYNIKTILIYIIQKLKYNYIKKLLKIITPPRTDEDIEKEKEIDTLNNKIISATEYINELNTDIANYKDQIEKMFKIINTAQALKPPNEIISSISNSININNTQIECNQNLHNQNIVNIIVTDIIYKKENYSILYTILTKLFSLKKKKYEFETLTDIESYLDDVSTLNKIEFINDNDNDNYNINTTGIDYVKYANYNSVMDIKESINPKMFYKYYSCANEVMFYYSNKKYNKKYNKIIEQQYLQTYLDFILYNKKKWGGNKPDEKDLFLLIDKIITYNNNKNLRNIINNNIQKWTDQKVILEKSTTLRYNTVPDNISIFINEYNNGAIVGTPVDAIVDAIVDTSVETDIETPKKKIMKPTMGLLKNIPEKAILGTTTSPDNVTDNIPVEAIVETTMRPDNVTDNISNQISELRKQSLQKVEAPLSQRIVDDNIQTKEKLQSVEHNIQDIPPIHKTLKELNNQELYNIYLNYVINANTVLEFSALNLRYSTIITNMNTQMITIMSTNIETIINTINDDLKLNESTSDVDLNITKINIFSEYLNTFIENLKDENYNLICNKMIKTNKINIINTIFYESITCKELSTTELSTTELSTTLYTKILKLIIKYLNTSLDL